MAAVACGGFATERHAGRRYRSTAVAQQQRRRSTAISSKCGQCHVDSRGTRLNTDLLKLQIHIFFRIFYFNVIHCMKVNRLMWQIRPNCRKFRSDQNPTALGRSGASELLGRNLKSTSSKIPAAAWSRLNYTMCKVLAGLDC